MPGRFYLEMHRIFEGLSDRGIARELGLDHSSVRQWKRGSEPSGETIKKICQRRGWSTAEEERLNLIADGYAPEEPKQKALVEHLFKTIVRWPESRIPEPIRSEIRDLKEAIVNRVWEALPPPPEDYEEPDELIEECSLDELKAQIAERDVRIATLEAENTKLKAHLETLSKPSDATPRARRKK